jgi:hypothetical protein
MIVGFLKVYEGHNKKEFQGAIAILVDKAILRAKR